MHSKTFLSNLNTERKRLIRTDLSNLDNLRESIKQLEDQISDTTIATNEARDYDEVVREVVDEFNDALDNLRVLGSTLERTTDEYVKLLDEAENFATTLDDLLQMKTEDVARDFAKNAEALGINPEDVKEYSELVELNKEATDATSETYGAIKLSDNIIEEATRLINNNNL